MASGTEANGGIVDGRRLLTICFRQPFSLLWRYTLTASQRLRLEQSEIRQSINAILSNDEINDEGPRQVGRTHQARSRPGN